MTHPAVQNASESDRVKLAELKLQAAEHGNALLEAEIQKLRNANRAYSGGSKPLIVTDMLDLFEVGCWVGENCKEAVTLVGVLMPPSVLNSHLAGGPYNQPQHQLLWQASNDADGVHFKLR